MPFAANEVEKGDKGKLEKGCDVSFFYAINPKNKEICAVQSPRQQTCGGKGLWLCGFSSRFSSFSFPGWCRLDADAEAKS